MREMLSNFGFDGINTPVIWGSALLALKGDTSKFGIPSLKTLLDALDTYIPNPTRDYTSPFILPIDNSFNVPGRGTVVVGTIKQGIMQRNMHCNLLGFNENFKTSISDIQARFFSVLIKRIIEAVGSSIYLNAFRGERRFKRNCYGPVTMSKGSRNAT